MRTRSLNTRLLISVSVLLLIFFGVTIFALDIVFRDASMTAMRGRLEAQVFGVISACDEKPGAKLVPGETLAEARFNNPGSGLYGQIARSDGEVIWNSPSFTGSGLDLRIKIAPGKRVIRELKLANGSDALALSLGFEWEFPNQRTRDFVFTVVEDLGPYHAGQQHFREQLFVWFGALIVLLLGSFAFLLRWVLRPIRRVESEIQAIESGSSSEFGTGYPRELEGITSNMNTLLRNEHERLSRYRNTLGNLAHSLKTPLAVIRSAIESDDLAALPAAQQLVDPIARMDDIVRYQLKRAAMSGGSGLGSAPIEVKGTIEALRSTLLKVYADKRLTIDLNVEDDTRFIGDQGDLMEIVGNLLDNACKWSKSHVIVTATRLNTIGTRREGLTLILEDDGPGIASDQREHVLKRGARLDERVGGQGIGLSVVQELAQLSGGGVTIDSSELGGAKITVRLPAT